MIYGCNERCTYCVVPNTRGQEQSRTPDAIRVGYLLSDISVHQSRTLCAGIPNLAGELTLQH